MDSDNTYRGLRVALIEGMKMNPEREITTWAEYATVYNQCFVRYARVTIQATRIEPSREVDEWTLFLPSPHAPVSCKSVDEARQCASRFGCSIIF